MRRGDLFQRFFLRFLGALLLAFLVLVLLVHLFQKRIVVAEWRADMQQETRWLAAHTDAAGAEALARAWRTMHSTVRLTVLDEEWRVVADSHDAALGPRLEAAVAALREGHEPGGLVAAAPVVRGGGWLLTSRPSPPAFPAGLRWELPAAALGTVVLVALALYPVTRSISRSLGRMRAMADRVAAGDYGRTLDLDRGDELGALAGALDEMSRKLAEAEALRTRLLHDVSHELRSPLGRIRVLAETLRGRPERLEERVEGIVQEVELLDRIVGDLLESACALPGPGGVEPRRTSLVAWSRDAFPRLAAEAEARRVAWRARVPERELEVEIDPQRLTQALGNLVDNSLHALAGVPGPRLDVTLAVEPESWSLAVEDNGPGIPREDQPHVFLRFYRVGEDRARGRGGAGLGLALVEAITTAHGGTVALESEPGAGTTVILRFPR